MPLGTNLPTDPSLGTAPNPLDVLAGTSSIEVGQEIIQGDLNLPSKTNANTATLNFLARLFAGIFVVGEGLDVNPDTGLTCAIDDGYALIDGLVVVEDALPYVLPASQSNIWLWLKQDGTFTHTLTTTPPASKCCLLAHLSTDGSSVLTCDASVAYTMRNGLVWRNTDDDGPPTDTPSASQRTFRNTLTGAYAWDGAEWKELAKAESFPRWYKFSYDYTDIQTAALTNTLALRTVPAGSVVHAAKVLVTEAFVGASISAMTFDLGNSGTPTAYVASLDALSLGSDTYGGVSFEDDSGTTDLELLATAVGANLSALSAGGVEVYLLLSVAG